ncbi:MAG: methionine--tRNA ligase subunit beta [Deltaproteobacteria bacterium RBG_16_54_11]|jgi:methionine--tRNA ligase beta chain|nr:MAG: methionine--tRNA ligase subunit beta [Deltaproteobacteria bacterium RBG_16_54_11]
MITFDDFMKLDIRIGTVTAAEKVQGADKLIRLELDMGGESRQVVAGMAHTYAPEDFMGKQVPILVNLEPRKLRGIESQGMILAADVGGKPVMLIPDREVPPGSAVR